jgi:molybdate transport system ATP-binding protein
VTRPATDLPLLRLRNVTLRVRGEDAFPDTTWTLACDEQWAVVGGTGSGKSTLLQAVCGDVPLARGEIEYGLDGRGLREGDFDEGAIEMVSVHEHRRLLAEAMDYHQARWSPVGESQPVTVRGLVFAGRGSRRRWRDLATLLEIGDLLGRSIGSLSNGEMRKVLLARALLAAPKLLILDSPFAGLDTESRHKLRSVLHRLMGEDIPILLATARLDEIPRRVTHLLCVEAGAVVAQGRKRAVLATPAVRRLAHPGKLRRRRVRLRWRRRAAAGRRAAGIPLVEIAGASVTYDKTQVLRRVSWTVRSGQNWVLRGRNGSGKSTLISLITADNPQAYANDIRLFGRQRGSGESIWEIKEQIGWMAPELQFHYYGEVSCYEVVCSGLYDTVGLYRERSRREDRAVRQWMENLEVKAWADEPFGALSDGQQRLVLIARALVKEPPLVILDEPCQGLDPVHRQRVLAILDQVAREPHSTLIYVTHHHAEIPASFGHELRLHRGRATYCGVRQPAR